MNESAGTLRERAIAGYHELLAADASLNAESFARLKRAMSARRLVYGERPLGVALRPHLLTRAQYERLSHASEVVAGAFEKIGEALLSDQSLLDRVGLTDTERRLALINPGFKSAAVTTRLDAFVHGDEVKFVEYNILLRNYFVERGIPTVICTPDELEYSGGKLRRGDFTIDLVYKRVIIHELLARHDETHPLVRAYAGGDVCLVNPFRCKMLHKKAAFEFLTDEDRAHWFTPQERELIRACVPWTRRVEERRTEYRGESIDLLEFVRKMRANFVLKPNDDYGGHGIFLGHRTGEAEWDERLAQALSGDYVVQELIDLRTEEFPVFDDERWSIQPMYVDVNPFLFLGKMDGALVRLSDSPIVNVTSGGGETGFFVIEGEVHG
ncbi:MAG: hypothetical protein LC754_04855 [Acidobacteria bacterium]|nr:hypothetical protein [Acidobacteriota bacterium]